MSGLTEELSEACDQHPTKYCKTGVEMRGINEESEHVWRYKNNRTLAISKTYWTTELKKKTIFCAFSKHRSLALSNILD